MSKKSIINKLRLLGYKAYYSNTLVSTFCIGYVIVITKGSVVNKFSVNELIKV